MLNKLKQNFLHGDYNFVKNYMHIDKDRKRTRKNRK